MYIVHQKIDQSIATDSVGLSCCYSFYFGGRLQKQKICTGSNIFCVCVCVWTKGACKAQLLKRKAYVIYNSFFSINIECIGICSSRYLCVLACMIKVCIPIRLAMFYMHVPTHIHLCESYLRFNILIIFHWDDEKN